ncbi:sugar transferase, partial [bacterium]|nr:sugar transferase [bacterium]
DIAIFSLSWFLAYWIRDATPVLFGKEINPVISYMYVLPFIVAVWVINCAVFGLYKQQTYRARVSRFNESVAILKVVFISSLIIMALAFLLKEYELGRSVVLISGVTNLILLLLSRIIIKILKASWINNGNYQIKTIIVGAGKTGIKIAKKIKNSHLSGYKIIGFMDDDRNKRARTINGIKVLGPLSKLSRIVKSQNIDEVFIGIPSLPQKNIFNLITQCEPKVLSFKVASDIFGVISSKASIDEIEDIPIINLGVNTTGYFYKISKRIMDICISIICILVNLPLWIIITLLVRFDSKGAALFRQNRVGQFGKIFEIYKFRTMYENTNKYGHAPQKTNDRRITRAGRLLRKLSLDELPQLINVLKGEMSLVGPRPEMPFIVKEYKYWQKKRLDVKPGITGLWQIIDRKNLPLNENLQYDFYYIRNQSLITDIAILIRTIPGILFGKGAY